MDMLEVIIQIFIENQNISPMRHKKLVRALVKPKDIIIHEKRPIFILNGFFELSLLSMCTLKYIAWRFILV